MLSLRAELWPSRVCFVYCLLFSLFLRLLLMVIVLLVLLFVIIFPHFILPLIVFLCREWIGNLK